MEKMDRALLLARVVCGILYISPWLYYAIVNGAPTGIEVTIGLYLYLPIGLAYATMKARLAEINEEEIKNFWATVALILAPFSVVLYLICTLLTIGQFVIPKDYRPLLLLLFFVNAIFGLCMPFILLTYWLKYRYREDEF
jgi:hypothetical protein